MPKKRVIQTLWDYEEELNLLPDPKEEKEIVVAPKTQLDKFFMQHALDNNMDDYMGMDDWNY